MSVINIVLLTFLGLACGAVDIGMVLPIEALKTVVSEVTIGAELADCFGVGQRKCLVVDGKFFYDGIEGFDYEFVYRYRILMECYDMWPGRGEPPQDASRYGYRLIEILEKTREP